MRSTIIAAALALCSASVAAQAPAVWRDAGSGIEFVWVAKGCFRMGTDTPWKYVPGERPVPPMTDEVPRHAVCVDGFWMGRHEVTREQWQRVMLGSAAPVEHPQRPAAHVTREEARQFVERLNAQGGVRFRLPTEAEWEYACLAGGSSEPVPQTEGEAMPALAAVAWYREPMRDDPQTRDVATMAANAWGLHDMLGNVAEWVEDVYVKNGYARHAKSNPKVTQGAQRYVLRGGSFKSDWWNTRCGARAFGIPEDRLSVVGLRVVRDADRNRQRNQ